MTAYATADDMIARYDYRMLGDLLGDGARTPAELFEDNDVMTAALNSATGRVKAAVLRAKRYTAADLDALTGESKAYLTDLTCRVAFWMLWQRKPYSENHDSQLAAAKSEYKEALELLRSGDEIFEITTTIEAGIPKVDTVTRVESHDLNLIVDHARGGNFYPRRRTYRDR